MQHINTSGIYHFPAQAGRRYVAAFQPVEPLTLTLGWIGGASTDIIPFTLANGTTTTTPDSDTPVAWEIVAPTDSITLEVNGAGYFTLRPIPC